MMDNLQEAYQAYQQALYHLSNPKVNIISPLFIISWLTNRKYVGP